MKKSLLAVAVAAALPAFAQAQTNVTMYGIADVGIASVKTDNPGTRNTIRVETGVNSSNRWGIRGTEDLGGGLRAFFNLEAPLTIDDGTAAGLNFTRRSFVGLGNAAGQILLGRDYSPTFWSLLASDTFGYGLWGNTLNYAVIAYDIRYNNQIQLKTASMGGLEVYAAYALGENSSSATPSSAGSGMDVSAVFNRGPLMATGAYQVTKNAAGKERKVTSLGGGLSMGPFGLKAGYSQSDSTDQGPTGVKIKMFNVGGTMSVGAGTLMAQVIQMKNETRDGKGTTVGVAYTHPLSKRTNIHVSGAFQKNNANGTFGINTSGTSAGTISAGADPTAFGIGVRHTF